MTAPRQREQRRPPSPPDRLPLRPAGRPSSKTNSAAVRPAGPARPPLVRRRLVRSARALFAAALLALSGALALPAAAQTTDPVWSAIMTVGTTQYGGRGYDVAEDEGGSLSDNDFEYNSTTYTVELVELDDSYAVSFHVDKDGLPEADILTLEIDGLAFPFEDTSDAGEAYWEWAVPEDLSNSDLPIGDRVVVCLRTAAQVCPTSAPSVLSVADVSAEEGEDLTFTVELSRPSTVTVTVDWATSGGTATSGTDFTAGAGTLTFAAGDTEQTVTVSTTEDMTEEDHETFTVTLSNATAATISGATATGVIWNDDGTSATDPVWSTVMTVAETMFDGHGYADPEYFGNAGTFGSLSDNDFEHLSATYEVYRVEVNTTRYRDGVHFSVDAAGLPEDHTLTLEIDGHAFPFEERREARFPSIWEWDVPEDLIDITNDLPIGDRVVVCLRGGAQVCPTTVPSALSVADVSAEEGEDLTFTVELSPPSTETVTVDWATSGGTATSGTDFTAGSGTLTFAAGDTEKTFTVLTTDDSTEEDDETFTVTLSSPTNAPISDATATGTIENNDGTFTTDPVWSATMTAGDTPAGHGYDRTDLDAPTIGALDDDNFDYGSSSYGVLAIDVAENAVRFVVAESGLPTNEILTLELGGHALAFSDRHNAISGQSRWYWTVPAALDDLETEFPVGSTATVCLRTATQVCPTGSIVTPPVTPPPNPTLSVGDAAGTEGGDVTFTATLSATATADVMATWTASIESGDTAVLADLGTTTTGPVMVTAGQTTGTFMVPTAPDATNEGNETFTVTLSSVSSNAQLAADATATGTIVNDDQPTVGFKEESVIVLEGAAIISFLVELDEASTVPITVDWETRAGSAEADVDYTAALGTLTFAAGDTEETITVALIDDDLLEENVEEFTVHLSGTDDALVTLGRSSVRGRIIDRDRATITVAEETTVDEDAGTVTLTLTASASSTAAYMIDYATEDGTAEAGTDYTAASGQVTFPAGETEQTIAITVLDDAADEDREDFKVRLSNATAQRIDLPADPARVLIEDNDDPPTVTVADGTATEGDKVEFTVTLSALSGLDVEVDYATTETDPQSAVSGTDFTAASGTLEIEAGNRTGTIEVQTTEDDASESAETFTLTISNPDNATLGAKVAATGTINDDANAAPSFTSDATFDAAENQTAAGTVLATDGDTGDDITGYAITGGADQAFFSIGATSGALTFDDAPNFEDAEDQGTDNTYVVTVQATSGTGERVKTATQTITVTVTDVAGEAPGKPDAPDVAAASVTSLTVNWSAPANAGPAIDDYDVRYREGTTGDWSDGGHTGAALTATLSSLSENTSYQVQVRATNDEGTGDWSDSGSGTTDANAAPTFSSSATFDAAENQTSAGTVLATDGDTGDDITGYAITGGADQAFFSIGATSGALTFDDAPNFEDAEDQGTDNTYVVTVQATSGTGTREKTATQTITVTVTDVAGEAPGKPAAPDVAAASVTSLTVNWSAPDNAGPAIDDYDVRYREGTTGDWSDGNHTGAATTATLSGLSENTSYQVQVRATNDEGTGSWSDSGSGTTDANAAPAFSSSAEFDAAENQTSAGTVLATDGDTGDDITGGADQAFFSIGATSGALTFDDAPNFEDAEDSDTGNTYVVTVEATSGTGTREKTATQTITVTVTDVAGEAPGKPAAPDVAAASVSSLTVTWTAPANAGPAIDDYDVRYREGTTGDWSDGNHTGAATTATLSGLSENTSYQVQVRATNDEGTGSWSDSGSGTTDANAAPAFSSSAEFDAAENQTSAGTVLATDGDTGDDITGYAITGGADQAFFSIGATSGALTFDAAPNFEDAKDSDNDNDYVVTVQATSGTGTREKTATQTITVTVTDVAGEAPGKPAAPTVAPASVSSLTVNWSAPANAGPAISDYDVQYREGTAGNWTDGGHTGAAVTATLSGLSENTSHQVQVRATNDEGTGDWSDSGSGTTDANPAGVTLVLSGDSIGENGGVSTVTATVSPASAAAFTVTVAAAAVSPAVAADFRLSANRVLSFAENATESTGTVTITGVDNDVDAADKTVTVSGTVSATSVTAPANRTLTLEDDDAAPVMTLEVSPAVIAEAAGSSTVTVRITNGVTFAEAQEIRLSFSGTAEKDTDYRVESERLTLTAGESSVTTPVTSVDDEVVDVDETILITATHDRNAVGTQQTITITDDDAAPVVTTTSPLLVEENETAVATLMATDTDDRLEDLEWEIAGGADRSKFTLTAGGELAFKVAKDYENPDDANRDGDYEVTVRVSDGANRAEGDFIVRLEDVDDTAPEFSAAVADGSTLTLAYSEALDSSSVPGTDAFTVTGGNATRTVSGVRVIGSAVELTLDPAVEHGQTGIRVSYTVPTGTGATPIQDTAGNDADSFNNRQVSNNTGDTTGPAVETVSITSNPGSAATYAAGETIQATVTFDETVVVTGTPRLTLKVGGRDRTADYQSVTGGAVRFEYQVVAGDSDPDGVSIESNRLSRGGGTIRDGSQNDAVLEHDALADNTQHKVDGVAPVLVDPDGAVVNGATLTLTYDEALNGSSRPATSAYTVSGGSETRTVTRVRVSGSAVMLTLVPAVEHGETDLRVSYRPGANPIRDLVGNEAGVLTDQEVDNRTPDTTAPSIEGIELTSDPGNDETYAAGEVIAVRVRYNEPVRVDTTGGTPTLNLTVGNRSKTAGARSGPESTEVVFVYEVERGEVDEDGVSIPRGRISLNGGTIRDDGNNNAALSHDGLAADSGHRVDGVEPKLQSATVHAARLALSYGEALDEASTSTPSRFDFMVMVAGSARTLTQVLVSGNAVTLRLSSPVTAGETVIVSYRPGFNPVRDQVGNAVEALTDEPALPPLITISATEGASSVTEGTAVQFTLTREEPTAAALTVGLSVTERGEVIQTAGSYQPPEEVTFTVGDTTATLTVLTEDDEQQEGDGAVIATLQPGAGYRLGGASTQSAQVTVEDDEGGAPPGPIGPGLPPVPNPVPSAPRNLEALGGDEQVTLSWEAPEDDGGFPITDYQYLISRSGRGWISTESTDLTHTVTELVNGRLYVFQVRAVSAAGAGNSSHQVEVTPGVGRLEFAHFANGSSITSELVLVNVAHHPIRPWLYFYDREGERIAVESVVELTEELEVAEDGSLTVQTEMQPLQALTISTHGQGEVVAGSVTVLSNGPIGGVLRFDLPGVGVAGVGAGQPLRDALFPARRQAGGISTAAAIRNLEAEELVVSCQLMQEGAVLEEVDIDLQAKGQDGRFIEEVFTTTDTSNFVGMVRCTAPAGKLFVGVAVELDAGQGIFTTLPVLPVDRTVFRGGEYTLDFAHFANGASITSDLVLVNVSIRPSRPAGPFTTPIPPTRPSFYFYDRAGERIAAQSVVEVTEELEVTEDGGLTVQSELEPLQAVTISTHGQGEVVAGSVRVVAEGPIGGVLRFDLPGVGVAGVGTGQPLTDALFPARRQEGGISTAAAIRNLEAEELVVSCRLMQEGIVLEEVDIELEVNGQDGRFIEEVFTRTDTSDFVGLVRCTAEGEFAGVAVELDAGAGIFTTLPVVPVPERMSQQ